MYYIFTYSGRYINIKRRIYTPYTCRHNTSTYAALRTYISKWNVLHSQFSCMEWMDGRFPSITTSCAKRIAVSTASWTPINIDTWKSSQRKSLLFNRCGFDRIIYNCILDFEMLMMCINLEFFSANACNLNNKNYFRRFFQRRRLFIPQMLPLITFFNFYPVDSISLNNSLNNTFRLK